MINPEETTARRPKGVAVVGAANFPNESDENSSSRGGRYWRINPIFPNGSYLIKINRMFGDMFGWGGATIERKAPMETFYTRTYGFPCLVHRWLNTNRESGGGSFCRARKVFQVDEKKRPARTR